VIARVQYLISRKGVDMKIVNLFRTAVVMLIITFLGNLHFSAVQHEHGSTQQEPALKVEVNLVSLSVLVTDQNGQSITELSKEDFKVYEDKVEQNLSFFRSDKAPLCWGVILDRSGSMMMMMRDVYQAAVHVIDQGTEQDEMFIITFSDITQLVQDFSSNRLQLENSIIGLEAGGTTSLYDAVSFGLHHIDRRRR
jgi:Ca-activated chloride channel family protein